MEKQTEPASPFIQHKLPVDADGFTQSFSITDFDPATVEQFYNKFGFVIFNDALNEQEITDSIRELWDSINQNSQGTIKFQDPSTWQFMGFLNRYGFVNDRPLSKPQLWKNRSSPKIYYAFKRLFQITSGNFLKEPLLALFDRGSILRPTINNPKWKTKNIYHFDIYPWWFTNVQECQEDDWRSHNQYNQEQFQFWLGEGNYVPKINNFTKLQGVLAFSDTNASSGGFECVCGFQNYIKDWCLKNRPGSSIQSSQQLMENMQKVYQRKGSILIFTRQLPHNIYPNSSGNARYAQYLRMAPESSLCLTEIQKNERIKAVKKMIPSYLDVNNQICKQIYMLNDQIKQIQNLPTNLTNRRNKFGY